MEGWGQLTNAAQQQRLRLSYSNSSQGLVPASNILVVIHTAVTLAGSAFAKPSSLPLFLPPAVGSLQAGLSPPSPRASGTAHPFLGQAP